MKYLKIEDNKGYYWDGSKHKEIDKIDKEGILTLLNSAEAEDFEMDSYDEGILGHKVHQIIYENIYLKFKQFLDDKQMFKEEVEGLFIEAVRKYSVDVDSEELEELSNEEEDDDGTQDLAD